MQTVTDESARESKASGADGCSASLSTGITLGDDAASNLTILTTRGMGALITSIGQDRRPIPCSFRVPGALAKSNRAGGLVKVEAEDLDYCPRPVRLRRNQDDDLRAMLIQNG